MYPMHLIENIVYSTERLSLFSIEPEHSGMRSIKLYIF